MAKRLATSDAPASSHPGEQLSDNQLCRRFVTLDRKIALMRGNGGTMRAIVSDAERHRISGKLRRDAAKTEDLEEKVALAEEACRKVYGDPRAGIRMR